MEMHISEITIWQLKWKKKIKVKASIGQKKTAAILNNYAIKFFWKNYKYIKKQYLVNFVVLILVRRHFAEGKFFKNFQEFQKTGILEISKNFFMNFSQSTNWICC
jgi:hypothetical protein